MMDTNKPLQKKGTLSRVIGNETMLYNPDAGYVHIINKTAAFVWNLCNGCRSSGEMANLLQNAYEVAEDTDLDSDVTEILNSFTELGILDQYQCDP